MKYYIPAVMAAALLAGLTGCGGQAPTAAPATEIPSQTASPTAASRPVPDVSGKKFSEARKTLNAAGFYGGTYGTDGKKLTVPPEDTVVVASTVPAAGAVTAGSDIEIHVVTTEAENSAALKAKADAAKAAAAVAAAPKPTGLAATLPKQFPGYPLIVHGANLDYRVANWFKGKLVEDQVVALIPGVYTPYNPNVKDLLAYYAEGGDGDSMMRKQYMPNTGGAGWSGVLPGPEEPK